MATRDLTGESIVIVHKWVIVSASPCSSPSKYFETIPMRASVRRLFDAAPWDTGLELLRLCGGHTSHEQTSGRQSTTPNALKNTEAVFSVSASMLELLHPMIHNFHRQASNPYCHGRSVQYGNSAQVDQ